MAGKLFAAILVVVVASVGCASAEVAGHLMLFSNNFPEEKLTSGMRGGSLPLPLFVAGVDMSKTEFKYYDSLSLLLLALEKGEIDYLNLPRDVGRYVLENNANLMLKGVSWYSIRTADTLNFAFLEKNSELMKKFNEAIAAMTKDGTLAIFEKAYVNNYGLNEQPSVKFDSFDDAESIL